MAKSTALRSPATATERREGGSPSIGARIRNIRKQRSETLVSLAQKTGLSPSALSKIENNKMSPTFGNLIRLAEGLEISLSDLVSPQFDKPSTTARMAVTRKGEVKYRRTPSYDMGPLCADLLQKRMTPMIERVRAKDPDTGDSMISHGGEEFVYVLDGAIEVHTEFYKPVRLDQGDSIYLDSQMSHTYVTVGEIDAEILMIWLSPQSQSGARSVDIAEAMLKGKS